MKRIPLASSLLLVRLLGLVILLANVSGCSVLVGNVKPVDQKSETYRALNLAEGNPDWKKLELAPHDGDPTRATDSSDVAYQSTRTSSIISLNSVCRPGGNPDSLHDISRLLFLGITDVSLKDEKDLQLEGVPALQTTVQGRLNGEQVRLRSVVLRKEVCVYDLMYVARPDRFASQEPDFNRFVASLRLK